MTISRHYEKLGEHGRQYASLLTFAALEKSDGFTIGEFKSTTEALPAKGKQEVAQTLLRAIEGAGEQRAEYWHNRILPYWKSIWPKSREYITPALSNTFARLCIAAREAFPDALEVLKHWLQPIEHLGFVIHLLDQEALAAQFPEATLEFLDTVVRDDAQRLPADLQKCLDDIKTANPGMEEDGRFRRLMEHLRRQGGS